MSLMPRNRADPGITVKDVAAASGYAIPTVIDILGGRGERYSAKANTLITAAAKRLGWKANRAARAMRTGRTECIALLGSTHSENSVLPQSLLDSLDEEVSKRGRHLAIARLDDDRLSATDTLPGLLNDWACDGLLINYQKRVPPILDRLVDQLALPAIWLNNRRSQDAVYPDEIGIGRRIAEGVLRAGHRRVAYLDPTLATISNASTHFSCRDRLSGITQACAAAGITCRLPIEPDSGKVSPADLLACCLNLLRHADRPSAVILGDHGPLAELGAAALASGLDLLRDLCLVTISHDNLWCLGHCLAGVRIPSADLAAPAVALLEQRIADPQLHVAALVIPGQWWDDAPLPPPAPRP